MSKIGLMFGTYNPIHIGHTLIAKWIVENSDLDEVWLVVSPLSPYKQGIELVSIEKRLMMAQIAVGNARNIAVCDAELHLPKPSYTIDTIDYLRVQHPDCEFSIIMGGDNVDGLVGWKNYERLLAENRILVFPRHNYEPKLKHENIHYLNAPRVEISSTAIRQMVNKGIDPRFFVCDDVADFIMQEKLYH